MNDLEHPNVFDQIQDICRNFRKRLKRGELVSIATELDRVDESGRENLFQNLLHIEIEFRRRNRDEPDSDGYIRQFPEYAGLIRQAFFESTMMSQNDFNATPGNEENTVTLGMPAARRLGEYELVRELGRGGFGVVYEARHLQRGDRVALKTLPAILDGQPESSRDAERLHRFRQEFRSLSEINHPHLAGMQTLEVDGKQWFFTMDLIEGVDFLEHVRPGGRLDEQRLRASLKQLVRGVVALHQRGIVHRDLKPSNVLVGSDGHLVILDFGLVAELQNLTGETLSVGTQHFAGTPRYAAPEQATGQRGASVDWYALGVMVYEAITGEVPLKGSGVELLLAKQSTDPPRLVERQEVPRDLAEWVDALLQRNPALRPSDDQIAETLGVGPESTLQDSQASSSGESASIEEVSGGQGDSLPAGSLLVGRDQQMAQLEQRLREFRSSGQPQMVRISGRSGEGKTSLAEKFLSRVRREGEFLVLAGRCYDRESVPFKAIDCWTDALVNYLRKRNADEVASMMPNDIGMLARLFPVLRRVDAIDQVGSEPAGNVDSRQARYRAFAALKELLASISRRTPVILFIDDVQWGDADSAKAIHEICKPPAAPSILLLCSYRSDEAERSAFLRDWRQRQDEADVPLGESLVEVLPLSETQCLQLASARLGLPPETLRQHLGDMHRGTQGNPYFIDQLLEGYDDQSGDFHVVPLEQIIERKLARLAAAAKPLLESLAVAGQSTRLSEMDAICEESANTFSIVTHMRSERLVRLIGDGDGQQVDTYHDKIRETVLAGLTAERRREMHLRHGRWLEDRESLSIEMVTECLLKNAVSARIGGIESERVFDIAHHYFEARHSSAFAYQLLAGVTSLASYAGDEALVFLQRAESIVPSDAQRGLLFLMRISMGRAYLISKKTDRAREVLEASLEVADSEIQQAMVHLALSTAQRFEGLCQQAIDRYDVALKLIGAPRPRTKLGALASIFRDTVSVLSAGSPRTFRDPAEIHETETSILEYGALRDVGGLLLEKDLIAFLACGSRACRKSVRLGTAESLVAGYEWAAGFFGAAGLFPIAKIYARRAAQIERLVPTNRVAEQRLLYYFGSDYWMGDLSTSGDRFLRGWPTVRRLGEHNEAIYRPHMLRHVATFMHPTSVEFEWAGATLKAARELGSEQQLCWGTYDVGVAEARRGNLTAAKQRVKESLELLRKERHSMTESIRGASLGFIHLQCSDYDLAREVAGEAWRNAVQHLILIDVAAFALPVYMESLAGPRWIEGMDQDRLRSLRRLGRWAKALFLTLPNHQPHLLRVSGRYNAGRGRLRKARKQFRRSVQNARSRGMDYAAARAMLDLAAISSQDREELQREAITLLKKTESVIPEAEGWLLGQSFDSSVVAS